MIKYLGIEFSRYAEFNAYIKAGHIKAYRQYAEMFANNPTMELSVIMSKEADVLHARFGMTWNEIEEIEIAAIQTA